MKIHAALVVLLIFCMSLALQNTEAVTPDWQYRLKLRHWTNIANISDRSFIAVKRLTRSDPNCALAANSSLRRLTQTAWLRIWSCIDASASESQGQSCAREEEARASTQASAVVKRASACVSDSGRLSYKFY